MRKLFTTLKSVVAAAIVASMTLAASCSYDDTALNDRVNRVEQDLDQVTTDLAALTERVNALEQRLTEEVANLTALINGKVVVTGLEADGNGTKVTLSDGSSFTVYPECTVEDTDTNTTVAPYKHTDGVYYWAIFNMGEFTTFLEIDGQMVPLYDGNDYEDGECDNPYTPEAPVAPQFRVNAETGNIEVSIDGGATWVESGLSAAATGMQVFAGVADNGDGTVTFTLFDGSTLDVVKAELIEFDSTRGQLYVKPGETIDVTFSINDAVADVNVMNQPLGWKATIELAEADEESGEGDEVDPGMGIMAAGGTDFVLKITGPSQDFINAGYAETSGFVSVHFNSASGACKVGKIAVSMAEITLEVDKAGMVTVTNTWVDKYEQENWGDIIEVCEFNNYYFTIMPIQYYTEDLASIYNSSWWEWNVPAVGGWVNNFFYNVNPDFNTYDKNMYVEGENEKWVFQASLEEILNVLDWSHSMTYEGESFAVIVTPTDPQSYGSLKIEQSQVVFFKQLNVKMEVAEAAWNNVYFNATLRGANAYHFNIIAKAELDLMISNGWYADQQSYFNDYLFYWASYGSQFGSHSIYTDVAGEGLSFNEIINAGEEWPYNYDLSPNTEYIMAILAEEDGKTEYVYEDIKFVEFKTADVVAASTPFEYTIEQNVEDTSYGYIYANVTVPETAVAVYSRWYDEEFISDDELKNDLITNGWCKVDFSAGYTYELSTSVNGAGVSKYLGLLIVDAEGNYSTGWGQLKSKEVLYNDAVLTLENVEFLTEGGVANITVGGVEGLEVKAYKAYVADMAGYYVKAEDELQDLAYGDNYQYIEYTTNPFTITRTAGYKYVATKGKTYQIAVAAQFADGTVSKTIYQEVEFPADAPKPFVSAVAKFDENNVNWVEVTFTDEAGNTLLVPFGNGGVDYLNEGTWDFQNWYNSGYAISNVYYNVDTWVDSCVVVVAYANGAYDLEIKTSVGNYTYDGAIEGFVVPEGGDEVGDAHEWTFGWTSWGYKSSNENELLLYESVENTFLFDINIAITDNKIPDGTYSNTNGGIQLNYCKHRYGASDGNIGMVSAELVVTNNDDGTTTIVATWVPNDGKNETHTGTFNGTLAEY